jgi:hypothetical protein
MARSFTPQLKKLLVNSGCSLERQEKEIMKFGIAQSTIVDLWWIIL